MINKIAYRASNYRATQPRRSNDMYAAPSGWQVAEHVPSTLGRIAQEILSRAVDEGWPMPSEIPLSFEGKKYIARFQIHGPNQFNKKKHPGIGLYEEIGAEHLQQKTNNLGSKLDGNFFVALKSMCDRLGCDPKDMLALMNLESGLDPNVTRPKHSARGLNQMIPSRLKEVGWKGSIDEYGRLSAVEQLPYIEKYFKNVLSQFGGSLHTLPLLYLANFWPFSLKNPDVRQGRPDAVIVDKAKHPREYKDNKGLDVDKDEKITYGDIANIIGRKQKQVANSDVYARMEKATGGAPELKPTESPTNSIGEFLAKIERMLDGFLRSASREDATNKYGFKSEAFTISVQTFDFPSKLEYASILKTAISEELGTRADIYTDGENVEVQCVVSTRKNIAMDAVKELCFALSDTFEYATRKIGGIKTNTIVLKDNDSNYQELDINVAEVNHRKFLYKFYKIGK